MSGWTSSEHLDELAGPYAEALSELEELPRTEKATVKTRDGGSYSYTYSDLGDILRAVRPVMAKHGLAVFQAASSAQGVVCVATTILHTSGQWISFDPLCLHSGNTPQEAGSAITYARRYTLLPALNLATEDDDGSLAQGGSPPSRQAAAAPPARREPTYRTPQEARIRAMLAELQPEDVKGIQASFKEQFGKSLSALEKDRHADALSYIEFLLQGKPDEQSDIPAEEIPADVTPPTT